MFTCCRFTYRMNKDKVVEKYSAWKLLLKENVINTSFCDYLNIREEAETLLVSSVESFLYSYYLDIDDLLCKNNNSYINEFYDIMSDSYTQLLNIFTKILASGGSYNNAVNKKETEALFVAILNTMFKILDDYNPKISSELQSRYIKKYDYLFASKQEIIVSSYRIKPDDKHIDNKLKYRSMIKEILNKKSNKLNELGKDYDILFDRNGSTYILTPPYNNNLENPELMFTPLFISEYTPPLYAYFLTDEEAKDVIYKTSTSVTRKEEPMLLFKTYTVYVNAIDKKSIKYYEQLLHKIQQLEIYISVVFSITDTVLYSNAIYETIESTITNILEGKIATVNYKCEREKLLTKLDKIPKPITAIPFKIF